jgi:hypothetical protein
MQLCRYEEAKVEEARHSQRKLFASKMPLLDAKREEGAVHQNRRQGEGKRFSSVVMVCGEFPVEMANGWLVSGETAA